jgi:hypothetical protein
VPTLTWTTNLEQYVFNLDGRIIPMMTIVQQIKRRGIRSQEEALGDHMLLTQRLEVIEHQRDVANIRNEILKDGVVRRKQKTGRQMQAAEMKVQTLQNELAEVKALLKEQTIHANQLQDAEQHRTQQWVQEQVGKTLRVRIFVQRAISQATLQANIEQSLANQVQDWKKTQVCRPSEGLEHDLIDLTDRRIFAAD